MVGNEHFGNDVSPGRETAPGFCINIEHGASKAPNVPVTVCSVWTAVIPICNITAGHFVKTNPTEPKRRRVDIDPVLIGIVIFNFSPVISKAGIVFSRNLQWSAMMKATAIRAQFLESATICQRGRGWASQTLQGFTGMDC
jgi:hypothetical protein